MASDKLLTLTLSDGSGALRMSEKRILRVLGSSTGTTVEYVDEQAETGIRKVMTVSETPAAIDTASTHIFPISVTDQQSYYINNKYVITADDNTDSVCEIRYDMAGQGELLIVTKETLATIATRINAL